MKKVEESLKKFVKKHVVVKGTLAPSFPKETERCLMVNGMEDIQEQESTELSGMVAVEKTKDAKGGSGTYASSTLPKRSMRLSANRQKGKLASFTDKTVRVTCYMDGDDNCLRIADISDIKPEDAK